MDSPIDERIQPGDVFVKKWGRRQIIWVALPRTTNSAKQPWMFLHTGRIESTYHTTRDNLTPYWKRERKNQFRFVGTIPEQRLTYLRRNWTLR